MKKHPKKEKRKGHFFEGIRNIFKRKERIAKPKPSSHPKKRFSLFKKKSAGSEKDNTKEEKVKSQTHPKKIFSFFRKKPAVSSHKDIAKKIEAKAQPQPKTSSHPKRSFSFFRKKAKANSHEILTAKKPETQPAPQPKPHSHFGDKLSRLFRKKEKKDSYEDIAKQVKALDTAAKLEEKKQAVPAVAPKEVKQAAPAPVEKKPAKQEPKKSFKESMALLFKPKQKAQPKVALKARKHQLRFYLEKAGLQISAQKIMRRIFDITVLINLVISGFLIYNYSMYVGYSVTDIVLTFLLLWTIVFAAIVACFWIILYVYLDLKIFARKNEIEEVLPDYLQLTASNIKAGMTIDRALWYAVRPRFGVLAYEIEVVAKETMKGIDLKVALERFASKYDSAILKRSISLLVEGIESGGEIGTLLNKISINIQETKIMKREMAANVTTYVIFISFATVAAAPALFALSGVLIKVISSLGSSVEGASAATSGFFISFSGSGITYADFRIFAMVSLVVTSIFSSMIIATIMKGSVKHGFKYIPMFVASTLTIFLIADYILGKLVNLVT